MSRWIPNITTIGEHEVIGRRLFGDDIFDDNINQGHTARIRVDHFNDNRISDDLSVDRLGNSGNPIKKVLAFLRILATAEAESRRPATSFAGWVACRVSTIRRKPQTRELNIIPKVDDPNIYHAEIDRSKFRDIMLAHSLACMLRDMFENDIGPVDVRCSMTARNGRFSLGGIWRQCRRFLARVLKILNLDQTK